MAEGVDSDPEEERIAELVVRVAEDRAAPAEREELALYLAQDPSIPERLAGHARVAQLGRGWLERVQADDRLQRVETSQTTRVERAAGMGLVLGGFGLSWLLPAVGGTAVALGFVLLVWSVLRVRAKSWRDDPYKDVKR